MLYHFFDRSIFFFFFLFYHDKTHYYLHFRYTCMDSILQEKIIIILIKIDTDVKITMIPKEGSCC